MSARTTRLHRETLTHQTSKQNPNTSYGSWAPSLSNPQDLGISSYHQPSLQWASVFSDRDTELRGRYRKTCQPSWRIQWGNARGTISPHPSARENGVLKELPRQYWWHAFLPGGAGVMQLWIFPRNLYYFKNFSSWMTELEFELKIRLLTWF